MIENRKKKLQVSERMRERERERDRQTDRECMCSHVCLYVYSDQLIAAGAPRKHQRLTVNRATLVCLLYSTRHPLTTSFNNSKTKLQTKFCQRKNRLRIQSRFCFCKSIMLFRITLYVKIKVIRAGSPFMQVYLPRKMKFTLLIMPSVSHYL